MLGYFMKQKSVIFEECKCLLVGQIMATSHFIENLPPEIVLCLLKYLSLSDILNFYQAYNLWHELIARFFMKPQIIALTAIDSELRKLFLEEGWTENCNDLSLIMTLWEKYKPYKGKQVQQLENKIFLFFSKMVDIIFVLLEKCNKDMKIPMFLLSKIDHKQ